ncbi:MAG: hypothetical protein WBP45_15535, partial [Daejeonella sp.]
TVPLIQAAGTAKVLTAKINAATSIATIGATAIKGFAGGGYTRAAVSNDPQGYVGVPTIFNGKYLAGEAGNEYIAPNWQLQNPFTANIIGALDALRLKGPSYTASVANAANSTGGSTPQSAGMDINALIAEIRELKAAVKEEKKRPVMLNRAILDDFDEREGDIKRSVNS